MDGIQIHMSLTFKRLYGNIIYIQSDIKKEGRKMAFLITMIVTYLLGLIATVVTIINMIADKGWEKSATFAVLMFLAALATKIFIGVQE